MHFKDRCAELTAKVDELTKTLQSLYEKWGIYIPDSTLPLAQQSGRYGKDRMRKVNQGIIKYINAHNEILNDDLIDGFGDFLKRTKNVLYNVLYRMCSEVFVEKHNQKVLDRTNSVDYQMRLLIARLQGYISKRNIERLNKAVNFFFCVFCRIRIFI